MNLRKILPSSTRTDDAPTHPSRAQERNDDSLDRRARFMAEQVCSGFQLHDRRQRSEAFEAFYAVDRNQFAHLSDRQARQASKAYVDALWEKDAIEKSYMVNGEVNPETIAQGEWEQVHDALVNRARVVGMDTAYATKTTEAWKNHKTQADYWSAFLEAQTYELQAAMQDPDYPSKPKEGQSGYGPVATCYVLAVELHDMHTKPTWEEAIRVMEFYYRSILRAQENQTP